MDISLHARLCRPPAARRLATAAPSLLAHARPALQRAARCLAAARHATVPEPGPSAEPAPLAALDQPQPDIRAELLVARPAAAAGEVQPEAGPLPWWEQVWHSVQPALKHAALAAVVVSLLLTAPGAALAKSSGGRIGGRSFSSGASSSRSSGHSSRGGGGGSLRGSSGYAGAGLGLGMGSAYMPTVPSPGYGYGYGMYSAPSVYISPGGSAAVAVRAAPVSPWWLPGDLLLWMAVLPMALMAFSSLLPAASVGGRAAAADAAAAAPVSVARVQVALLSSARDELQAKFAQLADAADTRSQAGLHSLLQEVLLVLLRHPECFAYGAAEEVAGLGGRAAESEVERLSLEERSKFSDVTRTNFRGKRAGAAARGRHSNRRPYGDPRDELVVVTLLVAARALPSASSSRGGKGLGLPPRGTPLTGGWAGVRGALRALGGVREEDVLAVELLWTPEADDDAFSRDDLLEDYPHLAPL